MANRRDRVDGDRHPASLSASRRFFRHFRSARPLKGAWVYRPAESPLPMEEGQGNEMPDNTWWKRGVVYQIYPRSFQDSNGDGIGDLGGIVERLDHLSWLGVDAVWISPFYPSPMKDFGYDISDYCGVDPVFGTLADFDRLIAAAHARGLRVILDFVPNHTSDQHAWFLESRASRNNPKRNWYIWHDPGPDGGPPNNWLSEFGGVAWTFDPPTGQYYYHGFLPEQPDLNWRNPAVRAAMYDAMRFWLDRGADGFRVDVMWHLIKDAKFRDNPPNPNPPSNAAPVSRLLPIHSADQPEVHDIVAEMRRVMDAYPERVLIGEIWLPNERLVAYYGKDLKGAHLPFNFQLIGAAWDPRVIEGIIEEYESALPPGGWPNWVLGNHDRSRIASRLGPLEARVAAMMLLTLRGTPTLYYGDEIGMVDVPIPPGRVRDPFELNVPGLGLGRDPQRTPMQWDDSPNAGFTSAAEPWLPLDERWRDVNVTRAREDPRSMLTLVRRLIDLRRQEAALRVGDYTLVKATGTLLVFARHHAGRTLMVALNLAAHPEKVALPSGVRHAEILLSTALDRDPRWPERGLELSGAEGVIVALTEDAA
jgi:alpha-glucosidase